MHIGVPRERKTAEKRVALTPDGAAQLVQHGHKVLVETNAGRESGFEDDQFKQVGAEIVPTLRDVWTRAELVVKVKEPHESEYQYFRQGLTVFDYLHLASMPELASAMVKGKVTGIAYELVDTPDGRLPLLDPMSEVAGKLSVQIGSYYLTAHHGGRGILMGGTVGVPPARVIILGAGISGRAACEVAIGMGARVTVLDINMRKLEKIHECFGHAPRTVYSTPAAVEREVKKADVLIGAVLVPGAAAPKIVTRDMVRQMKKGAVFVDISIDQGGCSETSKPTDLENPIYMDEGVIHYGVCNMPAQVPRTSTLALTSATLPYLVKLADMGVDKALKHAFEFRDALNTHNGHITNEAVSKAVGIPFTPVEKVLG